MIHAEYHLVFILWARTLIAGLAPYPVMLVVPLCVCKECRCTIYMPPLCMN